MNLQLWYEQAVRIGVHTYCDDNCEFLIYKGFKISKYPHKYLIENVRNSDFYEPLTESQQEFLIDQGFIKGADTYSYERNKVRYMKYIRRLEKVYDDRTLFRNKREINPKFYDKRLNNCEEGILKYTDLLFFYKAKILQYEQFYNINIKFIQNE